MGGALPRETDNSMLLDPVDWKPLGALGAEAIKDVGISFLKDHLKAESCNTKMVFQRAGARQTGTAADPYWTGSLQDQSRRFEGGRAVEKSLIREREKARIKAKFNFQIRAANGVHRRASCPRLLLCRRASKV